ncbi:MAG: hypothetical protein Q9162_006033 [Coniocarpon cinnabarinum]
MPPLRSIKFKDDPDYKLERDSTIANAEKDLQSAVENSARPQSCQLSISELYRENKHDGGPLHKLYYELYSLGRHVTSKRFLETFMKRCENVIVGNDGQAGDTDDDEIEERYCGRFNALARLSGGRELPPSAFRKRWRNKYRTAGLWLYKTFLQDQDMNIRRDPVSCNRAFCYPLSEWCNLFDTACHQNPYGSLWYDESEIKRWSLQQKEEMKKDVFLRSKFGIQD